MELNNSMSAVVTGGASGLGLATTRQLVQAGVHVVVVDLNDEKGEAVKAEYPEQVEYISADVTNEEQMQKAVDVATQKAPLRILVNCAGFGSAMRIVEKDGSPGSLENFKKVVDVNIVGTFNSLRLCAAAMAKNEPLENGERGCCIFTASVAAYEGQIGQVNYATGKAGIVGMTLVAARDLASKKIRVNTIAPGLFNTPLLQRLPEEIKESLGKMVPHPARLGEPEEYADLAIHMLQNTMLNGETIRLDGAIRMAPR